MKYIGLAVLLIILLLGCVKTERYYVVYIVAESGSEVLFDVDVITDMEKDIAPQASIPLWGGLY